VGGVAAAEADFDLVVVGGGINGAGLAREASGRGWRTLLVEAADLGSATSSASSKLIHGGLRYLEHGEFRLVRESLHEREHLLAIAPHLVRPLDFLIPHVPGAGRPAWMVRLGLLLYDLLAGRSRLPRTRGLRLDRPPWNAGLRPGPRRGFLYPDARTDDARLVLVNARDAFERGAEVRTRTRCLGGERAGGLWRLRLCRADGGEEEVRSRAVANLAGPWARQLGEAFPEAPPRTRLRLVRGSHIVVPRLHEGHHALLLQNDDGRIVFVIPWLRETHLVGTTEAVDRLDPAGPRPSEEEIQYLIRACGRWLERPPQREEVIWSFAGWRPLVDDGHASASATTRDYRFELSPRGAAPILHVFGGKLTTYRRLAECAAERLDRRLGGLGPRFSHRTPLPGAEAPVPAPPPGLEELAARHGCRWPRVASSAAELGADLGGGLFEAELHYLQAEEWARTAEDVLYRRTKAGVFMSEAQRREVARRLAPEPGAGAPGRP